jgi:hypothetical protein
MAAPTGGGTERAALKLHVWSFRDLVSPPGEASKSNRERKRRGERRERITHIVGAKIE